MINKIMIKDFMDGYYDVYIFEKEYKYEDVKKAIEDEIKTNEDYNLETISDMLHCKFDVKDAYYFDGLTYNTMMLDVNDLYNNIDKGVIY